MAPEQPSAHLIVNADDFGRSSSINQAVIDSHRRGILTSASLMVNGPAVTEAVYLARQHPSLAVGLHLTLIAGKSTLPHKSIPGLVDPDDNFSNSPLASGLRYWLNRSLPPQLKAEIAAQLERFRSFDLPLDHLNGHLHFHLHSTVLRIISQNAARWDIDRLRLTHDPSAIDRQIGSNGWFYRLSHTAVLKILSRRASPILQNFNIAHTDRVFGLLQNSRVNEQYCLRLIKQLPAGLSELYSHPDSDTHADETTALTSPAVAQGIRERNIRLTTYSEALAPATGPDTQPPESYT